jgi:hypothetical protein
MEFFTMLDDFELDGERRASQRFKDYSQGLI